MKPAQASWPGHLLCHFKLALVFLAVVLPYIVHFVHATSVGEITDQALALEISRSTFLAAWHAPGAYCRRLPGHKLALRAGDPARADLAVAAAARSARLPALHRRVVCGHAGHFGHGAEPSSIPSRGHSDVYPSNTISCVRCATSSRSDGLFVSLIGN